MFKLVSSKRFWSLVDENNRLQNTNIIHKNEIARLREKIRNYEAEAAAKKFTAEAITDRASPSTARPKAITND